MVIAFSSAREDSGAPSPGQGIVADGVEMVYGKGREATVALSGCSFVVEPGSWASVIGPSGCGKSTLLRILANLVESTGGAVSASAG